MKQQRIYILLLSVMAVTFLLLVTTIHSTESAYCRMLGSMDGNIPESLISRNTETTMTVEPIASFTVGGVVGDAVFENEQGIMVATLDGRILRTDMGSGSSQEINFTGPSYVTHLNPTEHIQLSSFENTLSVWDIDSGTKVSEISTDSISSIAVNHDGSLMAYGDLYQRIRLYELPSLEMIDRFAARNLPLSIAFHPSYSLFAYGTHGDNDSLGNAVASVVDYEANKVIGLYQHNAPVAAVAFQPDGEFLASASRDGAVHLWEICGNQAIVLGQHNSRVTSLAFSPNGDILVSGDFAGDLMVWDVFSQQLIQHVDVLDSPIGGIKFSSNGDLFLTYHAQSITVWRLSN